MQKAPGSIVVWGSAKWIKADHPTTPIKKCPYCVIGKVSSLRQKTMRTDGLQEGGKFSNRF